MPKATDAIRFVSLLIPAFCIFSGISSAVLAADNFNLTYSLTEGGNRLELSQDNQSKGVRININTDASCRYEVVQRIIQPLESRDVPGLAIRDNFVFRGLRGTNRYGDLRVSTGGAPLMQEELLYVSNTNGDADSFILVYGMERVNELQAGSYYGRISFTLNPVGSTTQPITQILEVYVNIAAESSSLKPQIEITTPTGSKHIMLSSKKEGAQRAALVIKINGAFKKPFSIKQHLAQPLESLEGSTIDSKTVSFLVKEAVKGVSLSELTNLTSTPQEIYRSSPDAEADSTLVVNYSLGDLLGQKAGKYRSRIQYSLDQMGVETKIDTLELDVENSPVFDLVVSPENQQYAIEFRDLKPFGPPKRNEITIQIKTNLGKKYQVAQEIRSELRNKEGAVIPSQYFAFQLEGLDTKGKLNFSDREEVKNGSQVLFVSDELGSPDQFKVIYELSCKDDVRAGDYSTNVVYSLLEI